MDCELFQKKIRDFIFDKIEYSEDLEEFLSHAKECNACKEELELYYTIHRGLGDISPPLETDEPMNITEELKYIYEYYNEYFEKQKRLNKIGRIIVVVLAFILVGIAVYVGAVHII